MAGIAMIRHGLTTIYRISVSLLVGFTIGCNSKTSDHTETDDSPRSSNAMIEIRPGRFDFGDVQLPSGGVTATFNIRNISAEQVLISNLISSCGCTVARPDKSVLDPGQTTVVKATVIPKIAGTHESAVRVIAKKRNSSDETAGILELVWSAKPRIQFHPQRIDAGRIAIGDRWEGEVTLNALEGASIATMVSSVKCVPNNSVSGSLEGKQGQTGVLRVSISPSDSEGEFKGTIVLNCVHPVGEIQIPITWTSIQSLYIEPKSVFKGHVHSGEKWSATFLVRCLDDSIANVSIDGANDQFLADRVSDGTWKCEICGVAPSSAGAFALTFPVSVRLSNGRTQSFQFTSTGIVSSE